MAEKDGGGGISVERLTFVKCPHWWGRGRNPTPYSSRQTFQIVCDRLGKIEDILGDDYDLERLREIIQADRDGRCGIQPCRVGETVHEIRYHDGDFDCSVSSCRWRMKDCPEKCYVAEKKFKKSDSNYIGKTVFLTREDAEAALKGEQNGKAE